MKAEFVQPEVDRDVRVTMKESQAKVIANVMKGFTISCIMDLGNCSRDDALVFEELYDPISNLVKD